MATGRKETGKDSLHLDTFFNNLMALAAFLLCNAWLGCELCRLFCLEDKPIH